MSRPVFRSGFADEINLYLDYKIASGYVEKSFCIILKSFDSFCCQRKIKVLPQTSVCYNFEIPEYQYCQHSTFFTE